jgi:hypothetical protein
MAEAIAPNAALPAKAGAPAVDPKAAAPKVEEATETITVNGQPVKLTKAQLIAYAQKGHFADGKLKSLDVLQKSSAGILNALKTPEGLLGLLKDPKLGASPKEVFKKLMASDIIDDELKEDMAKWVYQNVVVQAKKTPEEIERDKKLTDYDRLKKQEADQKQKQLSETQQAQVKQIYNAVRSSVVEAVKADKAFPQTEGSIRAVVDKLRVMNKQGTQITPQAVNKAVEMVKKDHLLHQQAMFDAIEDPEALIAFFGEERALKISRALVARLKAKDAAKTAKKGDGAGERKEGIKDLQKKLGTNQQGYRVMKPWG